MFFNKFRLSDPYRYKIPFLLSVPYFFIAFYHLPFCRSFILIAVSVIACTGFAGFGYATNDWGDIEKDQIAGKPNSFAELSWLQRILLTLFFAFMAIVCWFYLPFTWISFILLSAELILFVVYSFPPFRLKERGAAGVITDALYAHTIPALFAAYTFGLLSKPNTNQLIEVVIVLAIWQTFSGIRNILFHHLDDHDADIVSGTRTFATTRGREKVVALLKYFLIPVEVLLFLAYMVLIVLALNLALALVYLLCYALLLITTSPDVKNITYKKLCYFFLDDFYLECLPVGLLLFLCLSNIWFIVLLLFHILILRKNVFAHFVSKLLLNQWDR